MVAASTSSNVSSISIADVDTPMIWLRTESSQLWAWISASASFRSVISTIEAMRQIGAPASFVTRFPEYVT